MSEKTNELYFATQLHALSNHPDLKEVVPDLKPTQTIAQDLLKYILKAERLALGQGKKDANNSRVNSIFAGLLGDSNRGFKKRFNKHPLCYSTSKSLCRDFAQCFAKTYHDYS